MKIIDFNCLVGGWPFHRIRNRSFDALLALHAENGITGGYVSSTDAIFFNDPYEAELDLAAKIPNNSYHHVMTVNPMLPGCFDDIKRAVRDLNIKGIRILPGFHGYSLNSPEVKRLCDTLREYRLPLFLTLRIEDERVTYMFHPNIIPIEEIREFLNEQTGIPILLCNLRLNEILELRDIFLMKQNVYADCCGLKDKLFAIETLDERNLTERLVYGSLTPIFCLKSSLLLIEMSDLNADRRDLILSGKSFLNEIYSNRQPAEFLL